LSLFSTINAALEAARDIKSPIIIQFSNGGAAYIAGKGLSNKNQEASVIGAVAGAQVSVEGYRAEEGSSSIVCLLA
jgi:fructose/tagatose bisphosphate aldolase